jgi:hypothetical protein
MMFGKNSDTNAAATELFVNREIFKNTYAYADFARVNKDSYLGPKGNAYALGVIYVFDIKLSGSR